MATQAKLGYGTKLLIHDGTAIADVEAIPDGEFAEIAEITSGPDDEESTELVEVTNHQSTGNRREYIGGLIDGGDITIECNYIPTDGTHDTATGLAGLIGQTRYFRIEEPGETTGIQVPCVVTNVGRTRPVAEAMKFNVTLKKAGDVYEHTIS